MAVAPQDADNFQRWQTKHKILKASKILIDVTKQNVTMFYTKAFFKCTPLQRMGTAALGHSDQVNYNFISHDDYIEACWRLMQMQYR